jgi:hypothetical protein
LGSFCPNGSTFSRVCNGGTYCSSPATQVNCSIGFFCPPGSTAPIQCDPWDYCPFRTTYKRIRCLPGQMF